MSIGYRVLLASLLLAAVLELTIFLVYRGSEWPLGTEGFEAIGAFTITLAAAGFVFAQVKSLRPPSRVKHDGVTIGLMAGLLWTIEIGMNNVLVPKLPERD